MHPGPPEVKPETRTLTFVLPEIVLEEGEEAPAAMKTAWVAGDQIVVHGEYAKNQVTVTLAAGDISADGKSATVTVDNLYPYKREDCTSTLYASYPASLSDNLKHCFFYSKFSTTNADIMAASNSGDTFQFHRLCGILSISVEGDYEGYLLSTPKKEALGYEFLQVKLTDKEQLYKTATIPRFTSTPNRSISAAAPWRRLATLPPSCSNTTTRSARISWIWIRREAPTAISSPRPVATSSRPSRETTRCCLWRSPQTPKCSGKPGTMILK